jgi:hypothetical protein
LLIVACLEQVNLSEDVNLTPSSFFAPSSSNALDSSHTAAAAAHLKGVFFFSRFFVQSSFVRQAAAAARTADVRH